MAEFKPEPRTANGADGGKTQALVLNCGSSSVKYGLFDCVAPGEPLQLVCAGLVDKIGLDGTIIKHTVGDDTEKISGPLATHGDAMKKVVEILTKPGGPVKAVSDVKVVGHRVVHGGPKYGEPTILDDKSMAEIERVIPLAPLHNPANLMGIRTAQEIFKVPQVAVFDTAFHSTMPPESFRYAVPKELFEKHAIRRYGFHGTSYKYVTAETARRLGQPLSELNMIVCHLGNGASMACVRQGKVVDTTMGITPLEGLVMGTRSGDIDPGLYTFLCDHLKMSHKEVDTLLNKKSGLLGLSGFSDMREMNEAAKAGNEDAALGRKVYVERIRKYLGSFLVKLNGELDALVFTAGVGENDRAFWSLATAGLKPLGIEVDPEKIKAYDGEGGEIQSARSRAKVMVIPTQEELSIAEQSLAITGIVARGGSSDVAPDLDAPIDPSSVVTPKQFTYTCRAVARANKQHIILALGEDPRIVTAAGRVMSEGLASLTILGKPETVNKLASDAKVSLDGVVILDPEKAEDFKAGMTASQLGAAMLNLGKADGMVCDAGAIKDLDRKTGVANVTSVVFVMQKVGCKLFADCGAAGTRELTGAQELAALAEESAATARAFGMAPRIAMIAFDSDDSVVGSAAELLKRSNPDAVVEGPLEYDVAVCPDAAASAKENGAVAGKASVLVFPDTRTGSLCYRTVAASGSSVVGPLTQGLKRPANVLQPGFTVDDAVLIIAATSLQSRSAKRARDARTV